MRAKTPGLVLVALALGLVACGKRGDPRPPLRKTPPPIAGFAVAQRGERLEVTGTAPRTSTDGAVLSSVRVEILRAEGEGDFVKVARTRVIDLAGGETFREPDLLPAPGTRLRLAARAVASGKPSPLSTITTLVVQPPLPVPQELGAALAPDGVRLTWTGKVPPALPAPVVPEPPPPPPGVASRSGAPNTAAPAPAPGPPRGLLDLSPCRHRGLRPPAFS